MWRTCSGRSRAERDNARAISQENVQLHHRTFDAFNRRDLEAFLARCDPDLEFISYLMQVEGGEPYRGHDGVRSWWDGLFGVYPDFIAEIEEARDRGNLTVVRLRMHGHGVESKVPMEQTVWQVAEWRHEKVIWWCFVTTEAEALKTAALRE